MQEPIVPERLRDKRKKRKKPGSRRQGSLIAFTLAALGLIAYGAYYFFMPKQEKFVLEFYTYAEVQTADFLETYTARGTLTPKDVEIIAPKIGGTIEEVFVKEGQDVEKGAPLFLLYSEEIASSKNAAETELGEAQAKLAQLEIDQELELEAQRENILDAQEHQNMAEEHLELQKVLYRYGSIARVELEKAEQDLAAAKRRVDQSQRELELLIRRHQADRAAVEKVIGINQDKLAKAAAASDNFLVTAASSGRILSLKIPNNRIVAAHQELGKLADLTAQVVEIKAAPGQAERFGLGTPATISLGQAEYKGEISYIAPQAEQGTDGPSVLVRVDFLEEAAHLRPYSAVTADIHLKLHADSLFLPRGAYLTSGQQLFVYVIDGDQAVRREVQFGLLQGSAAQIRQGLELGEKVIISSYDAFRHLEEIKILPEGGHAL